MTIERIVTNPSAYQRRNFRAKTHMERPVLTVPAIKGSLTDPVSAVNAYSTNTKESNNNRSQLKQPLAVIDGNAAVPDGVVSHMVVAYNHQGKLRTGYEDSRNHVVYQMPSEVAAGLDNRMLTKNASANVKG